MKQIPLSRGYFAIVDDEDFETLSKRRWHVAFRHKNLIPYAAAYKSVPGKPKGSTEMMHRAVTAAAPGTLVDHINGDGLDNRRCNLRSATPSENLRNQRKGRNNTSGFKGVCRGFGDNWRAEITVDGKKKHLLYTKDIEAAARAYDAAAIAHFGEFARLNFPATAITQAVNAYLQQGRASE